MSSRPALSLGHFGRPDMRGPQASLRRDASPLLLVNALITCRELNPTCFVFFETVCNHQEWRSGYSFAIRDSESTLNPDGGTIRHASAGIRGERAFARCKGASAGHLAQNPGVTALRFNLVLPASPLGFRTLGFSGNRSFHSVTKSQTFSSGIGNSRDWNVSELAVLQGG